MSEWKQQFHPAGQTRDCVHGSLARSCTICEMEHEIFDLKVRIGELEGGCIMAAGFIAGTLEDPEISGTYRYLKSVLNPLDPKSQT